MTDDELLQEHYIQVQKMYFAPTDAGRMRAFDRLEEIDAELKRRRAQVQPARRVRACANRGGAPMTGRQPVDW